MFLQILTQTIFTQTIYLFDLFVILKEIDLSNGYSFVIISW